MFITKIAKRLMATVMTTALVLTGFVVAPKEVSAAEDTAPTVEVLGATLRLDGKSGYQSMRVGVQVKNASQAKACGIKLTIGERTYTVATDAENGENTQMGKNIYDYNTEEDAVVYTTVITDIPKDAFTTEIGVQGIVKAIGSAEEKISGAETKKSVASIVEGMKENNPNVEMAADGTLMKKINELDVSSTENIKSFGTQNNFYNWTYSEGTGGVPENDSEGNASVEYDNNEKALKITTDASSGKGLVYQVDGNGAGNYIYQLVAKSDSTTSIQLSSYFGNSPIGGKTYQGTGDWQTIEISAEMGNYGACSFATTSPSGIYYVKSFTIYAPLKTDDLGTIVPAKNINMIFSENTAKKADWYFEDTANNNYLEDGSVQFILHKENNRAMGFYINQDKTPINLSDYSKAIITLSSNPAGAALRTDISTSSDLKYDEKNPICQKYVTVNQNEMVCELDLTNANGYGYGIFIQHCGWNENTPEEPTITIKSIKFIAK